MKILHSAIDLNVLFKEKLDADFDTESIHKFEIIDVYQTVKISNEIHVTINDNPNLEIILTRQEIGKICEALK